MDFKISKSGDLIMEEKKTGSEFSLSFRRSENKGFSLSFHLLNETPHVENKGLLITFDRNNNSDLKRHAKVIMNLEEKIQRLKIALITEKGSLIRRDQQGSILYQYKHKDIHSAEVLDGIQRTVLDVARKILSNPIVVVSPSKGVGNLYFHNVLVQVFEENQMIFRFYV